MPSGRVSHSMAAAVSINRLPSFTVTNDVLFLDLRGSALSVRNFRMLLILRMCMYADLPVSEVCLVSVIMLSSVTPRIFIQSDNIYSYDLRIVNDSPWSLVCC